MTLAIVVLAAGQGTRMKSKKQKILHQVGGKPMVQHVFEAARRIGDLAPVLVVGPGERGVQDLFGEDAVYVTQSQRLGTGHATQMAKPLLQGQASQVIITYGDMPLLREDTLQRLAGLQQSTQATATMLSVMGQLPSSFGRIVRDEEGQVQEIVEVAEAKQRANSADLLAIRELNVGVYCFKANWLWEHIDNLPLRQARSGQEYYLTDLIGMAVSQGLAVEALIIEDIEECLGAGTREELIAVDQAFRQRVNRHWLDNGVSIIDLHSTYIDQDVTIGQDTIIWPNSYIQGLTVIGEDCVIGPNAILRNAEIGSACRIESAVVENEKVADNTIIPPYSIITKD